MIRPMYAGNPNLCAQKGLFSFWKVKKGVNPKTGKVNIDPTLRAPLDELVSDTVEVGDKPLMYKISIAKDDLPALYQYSKFHHIEASTLFPGYEGVVRNMKENQFFLAQKKREYRIQALT